MRDAVLSIVVGSAVAGALLAAACSNAGTASPRSDASTSVDSTGNVSQDGASLDTPALPDSASMHAGAQDGGGGDGCSSAPIASAPAQWMRPANCSGVGNLCSEGCGSAICQLIGNVCVPFGGVGASASSCAPYCLAFSCMTYEQASCFCTGDAGTQFPECACGPMAIAGLCASEGTSCANTPCCPCQGLTCVTDSVSGTVCRQHCAKNTDCATGCCNTTSGVCQDSLYCNCVDAGAACGVGGTNCCPGTSCLTFNADGGGPFVCYTHCAKQADCQSGCCSQKIPGLDVGACGPC